MRECRNLVQEARLVIDKPLSAADLGTSKNEGIFCCLGFAVDCASTGMTREKELEEAMRWRRGYSFSSSAWEDRGSPQTEGSSCPRPWGLLHGSWRVEKQGLLL